MDQREEDALQLFLENVNKYINGLCKKSMQIIKRKELKKRGYYIYKFQRISSFLVTAVRTNPVYESFL